ncbi:MAG: hypothetical protein V1647_04955, partial [Pseudomonadota bacterium]
MVISKIFNKLVVALAVLLFSTAVFAQNIEQEVKEKEAKIKAEFNLYLNMDDKELYSELQKQMDFLNGRPGHSYLPGTPEYSTKA